MAGIRQAIFLLFHPPKIIFSMVVIPNPYQSHNGNTSNSINMNKVQKLSFKHTFLEWQAEGLALDCSESVTSGLCSGEQFHKVTVMHLNAAKGKKYNFNYKTYQKSNL